jgi:hypothetical protein
MASEKHRYWVFLVYPDSAPEDWVKQLKDTHCPFAISPLHEPDDEVSKPHYHVVYYSPGPVRLEGVLGIVPDGIAANGHVEYAKSPTGYQRYLIHLDDLEKQQFPEGPKAIVVLNGFPLDLSRQFSAAELRELRRRVHEFIREFDVVEYAELLDGLMEYDIDMYDYACNHTILFNTYITSRRHAAEESD